MGDELITNGNFNDGFVSWQLNQEKFNATKLNKGIVQRTDSDGSVIIKQSFSKLSREVDYVINISPEPASDGKEVRIKFKRKDGAKNAKVHWKEVDGIDGFTPTITGAVQIVKTSAKFTTLADYNGDVDTIEIQFNNKFTKLSEISLKESAVVCPADVHHCPDGTTVGRDPNNNCEFPECPSVGSPPTICVHGISTANMPNSNEDYMYPKPSSNTLNGVYEYQGNGVDNKPYWTHTIPVNSGTHQLEYFEGTDYTGYRISWAGDHQTNRFIKVNLVDENPYGDGVSTNYGGTITIGDCDDVIPASATATGAESTLDCQELTVRGGVAEAQLCRYSNPQIQVGGELLNDSSLGGGFILDYMGLDSAGMPKWGLNNGIQLCWYNCNWKLSYGSEIAVSASYVSYGVCPFQSVWPSGIQVTQASPPSESSTEPPPSGSSTEPPVTTDGCDLNSIYMCKHPASYTSQHSDVSGEYTKTQYTLNDKSIYSNGYYSLVYTMQPVVTVGYGESTFTTESYGELENHEGWWAIVKNRNGYNPYSFSNTVLAELGKADAPGGDCPTDRTWRNYITNGTSHTNAGDLQITSSNCIVAPYIKLDSVTVDGTDVVILIDEVAGDGVDMWAWEVDYLGEGWPHQGIQYVSDQTLTINLPSMYNMSQEEELPVELKLYPAQSQYESEPVVYQDAVFVTTFMLPAMQSPTPAPHPWPGECGGTNICITGSADEHVNGEYFSPGTYDDGSGYPRRYWKSTLGKDFKGTRRYIYWNWMGEQMSYLPTSWIISNELGGEEILPDHSSFPIDASYGISCPLELQWGNPNETSGSLNVSHCPIPPRCADYIKNSYFGIIESGKISDWKTATHSGASESKDTQNLETDMLKSMALSNGFVHGKAPIILNGGFEHEFRAGVEYVINLNVYKDKPVPVQFLRKGGTKSAPIKWTSIDGEVQLDTKFKSSSVRIKKTAKFEISDEDWATPDTIEIAMKSYHKIASASIVEVGCNAVVLETFSKSDDSGVPEDWTHGGVTLKSAWFDQKPLEYDVVRRSTDQSVMKLRKTIDRLDANTKYTIVIDNIKSTKISMRFLRKSGDKNCNVVWNEVDGSQMNTKRKDVNIVNSATFTTTGENWNRPDTIEIWIENTRPRIGGLRIYKHSDLIWR
tara:strand:+ start:10596 stop:14030 length:3435 start_codon:yes stop_codon:yes gene_type:complete